MRFARALNEVRGFLAKRGWEFLIDGVRFRVVRPGVESGYIIERDTIELDPKDIDFPWFPVRSARYVVMHELGHRLAERFLGRGILRRHCVLSLFGDYNAPYRRNFRGTRGWDRGAHVSRYAAVHPADDFAETFAVNLWVLAHGGSPAAWVTGRGAGRVCLKKGSRWPGSFSPRRRGGTGVDRLRAIHIRSGLNRESARYK